MCGEFIFISWEHIVICGEIISFHGNTLSHVGKSFHFMRKHRHVMAASFPQLPSAVSSTL
jgi:hypothetical protein